MAEHVVTLAEHVRPKRGRGLFVGSGELSRRCARPGMRLSRADNEGIITKWVMLGSHAVFTYPPISACPFADSNGQNAKKTLWEGALELA